jgi:hypothetical protein
MRTLRGKKHRSNFIPALAAMASLLTLVILCFETRPVSASDPNVNPESLTSIAAAPNGGFWVQLDAGTRSRTLSYSPAPTFIQVNIRGSIAAIPGQNGYWIVGDKGTIDARGNAPVLCGGVLSGCSGFPKNPGRVSGIWAAAASPDGQGLWAVGGDGRVWTAGTARSYGDVTKDSHIPVAIAVTPSGRGYNIAMADGGVYSFGDALFYGSFGGKRHDVTGMSLSYSASGAVNGYWLVTEDGGIHPFGDAPFLGSSGGSNGGSVVTGIATLPDRRSYVWVHADGGIDQSQTIQRATITSSNLGTAWTVPDGSTESGTPIQLLGVGGGADQQWDLWPTTSDGSVVQLVNVNSDLCADVTQQGKAPFKFSVIQYPCKGKTEGWDNQRFLLSTDSAGYTGFAPLNNPGYRVSADSSSGGLTLVSFGGVLSPSASWILNNVQ